MVPTALETAINGALLVDKPAGVTSHDVVAIFRRTLKESGVSRPAVGHTGTLDPFATGLLVVLTGKATRLARFLDGFDKVYRATVRLGQGSDTDDGTGTLTEPAAISYQLSADQVREALAGFVGTHQQMPPAFSAKKIDGERAYARARKGEEVVLKPVEVTIHSAELLEYDWPDAEVRMRVSTGTYIRALARDLGAKLGLPAHCAALRREAIGPFTVAQAETLAAVQAGTMAAGRLTMLDLVPHLIRQELDDAGLAFIRQGRRIATNEARGPLALVHGGELVAVAEVQEGSAQPVVVLVE